ncbi:hypothetical protein CTAYLR_006203 [Chrysophaeum taylorii]|uniref:SAC3/GANP/THP3 conserved domain-containing protein n=1 Tax=Chrysophaeum taylorii TaxID=2483200 RepID=A0AAD7XRC4_9STRA|nr:hypothetical protein CTAYLR_006203 [Chrysophaeum taylorii]
MPDSLKAFAERAFSTCGTDGDRGAMQAKLHAMISRALHAGRLHATDWATVPVPALEEPPSKRPCTDLERQQRDKRAERFSSLSAPSSSRVALPRKKEPPSAERTRVLGTCADLEKDYFRLTSAPDPATIRPEPVLEAALQALKTKWRIGGVDYAWMCNQLKSIRQDLTVQGVKTRLAVNVYETHARVALENSDLNEFNQCQTQLKDLSLPYGHPMEFLAYRILYYLYLRFTADNDSSQLLRILAQLPADAWKDDAVRHAIACTQAVNASNYSLFFKLLRESPFMGQYILDMFADRIRIEAAQKIAKSHRPNIPLDAVRCAFFWWLLVRDFLIPPQLVRQLGLEDHPNHRKFLRTIGFKIENRLVLTKDSKIDPSRLAHSSSLL